jgi:hypothetical protein
MIFTIVTDSTHHKVDVPTGNRRDPMMALERIEQREYAGHRWLQIVDVESQISAVVNLSNVCSIEAEG